MRIFMAFLMKLLFLTGLTLNAQTASLQGTPPTFAPAEASGKIVDAVIKSGVSTIGDLDLPKLAEEIKRLNFKVAAETKGAGNGAFVRQGGRYLIGGDIEFEANGFFDSFGDCNMSILALHESLGALNYGDRNYQISSPLAMLSGCGSKQSNLPLPNIINDASNSQRAFQNFEDLKADLDQKIRSSGGVTGAGGGGDGVAGRLKVELLRAIYALDHGSETQRKYTEKRLEAVLALQIEAVDRDVEEYSYIADSYYSQEINTLDYRQVYSRCLLFSKPQFPGLIAIVPACLNVGLNNSTKNALLAELILKIQRDYVR